MTIEQWLGIIAIILGVIGLSLIPFLIYTVISNKKKYDRSQKLINEFKDKYKLK
jgi:di/tricarboxylate transporter